MNGPKAASKLDSLRGFFTLNPNGLIGRPTPKCSWVRRQLPLRDHRLNASSFMSRSFTNRRPSPGPHSLQAGRRLPRCRNCHSSTWTPVSNFGEAVQHSIASSLSYLDFHHAWISFLPERSCFLLQFANFMGLVHLHKQVTVCSFFAVCSIVGRPLRSPPMISGWRGGLPHLASLIQPRYHDLMSGATTLSSNGLTCCSNEPPEQPGPSTGQPVCD